MERRFWESKIKEDGALRIAQVPVCTSKNLAPGYVFVESKIFKRLISFEAMAPVGDFGNCDSNRRELQGETR
jgi:hypothetical protein